MRSTTTWVALFYVVATLIITTIFDFALSDIFVYLRKDNAALLGPQFTISTLIAFIVAVSIAVYTSFINKKARLFIEQCIVELDKVAWPTLSETRNATYIVIVTSVIASIILGFFDTIFGWLTSNNLFLV